MPTTPTPDPDFLHRHATDARFHEERIRAHRKSIGVILRQMFPVGSKWGWMRSSSQKNLSIGTVHDSHYWGHDGYVLIAYQRTNKWTGKVSERYKHVRWDKLTPIT